jgi:hypothetical protein
MYHASRSIDMSSIKFDSRNSLETPDQSRSWNRGTTPMDFQQPCRVPVLVQQSTLSINVKKRHL